MPFGTRLKNLLQSRNLSQVSFASLLGITRGRLNNYIAGRSEPDYATLRSIATVLQVSTDYLLGLEKTDETSGIFHSYSDIAPGSAPPPQEKGPFTWIPLYEARPAPYAGTLSSEPDGKGQDQADRSAQILTEPAGAGPPGSPLPLAWLHVEEKHTTPPSFRQSYALLINDNSLAPQLLPGDIVFIRPLIYSYYYLATSDPGILFAVRLHHTDKVGVSLKHCTQTDDILVMSATNPAYPPIAYDMKKVLFVPIMGKAVSMTRSYLDMRSVLREHGREKGAGPKQNKR